MFLNAIMLAGIGAAVVPLVLHLLSRASYRGVDWGAMMFLTAGGDRRQSMKLKQWSLLILRMMMISLLAISLARPVVRAPWTGLTQEAQATAVIVLDCSASMSYNENGRSRFEMARKAVMQILSSLRKGDQVSLILLRAGQAVNNPEPTTDFQSIATRVSNARVSTGSADITEGLTQAAKILEQYGKSNRELFVVCDRQALTWRNADEKFQRMWQQQLGAAQSPARFVVIPVGSDETENVAVEEIKVLNPPLIQRQPAEVEITVRNYGSSARTELPLVLRAGNREILNALVSIQPKSTASIRTWVQFADPGPVVLTAIIRIGGMTPDNRMDLMVRVNDDPSPFVNFYKLFVPSALWRFSPIQSSNHNLVLGDPLVARVNRPINSRKATVLRPDSRQEPVEIRRLSSGSELRYVYTQMPGHYRIQLKIHGRPHTLSFIVRPSANESDLTPLKNDHWARLEQGLKFQRIDPDEQSITLAASGGWRDRELWPALLAMVLILGIVELGLARRWSAEGR